MKELIEKLEKAGEGSRELDTEVWVATNGKGQPMKKIGPPWYKEPRFFCNPNPNTDWIGYDLFNIALRYTTSLDAALTLVPEERIWSIGCIVNGPGFVAILNNDGKSHRGATPPLALCIAALKARMEEKT